MDDETVGVFIRGFDPQGHAFHDGRLLTDDRLLSINEIPLDKKLEGSTQDRSLRKFDKLYSVMNTICYVACLLKASQKLH